MAPLSSYWFNFLSFFFSFLLPLSSLFSFLFPSFPLFSSFLPSLFLFLSFFSFFLAPFGDPGGPRPPKPPPPKIRPCSYFVLPDRYSCHSSLVRLFSNWGYTKMSNIPGRLSFILAQGIIVYPYVYPYCFSANDLGFGSAAYIYFYDKGSKGLLMYWSWTLALFFFSWIANLRTSFSRMLKSWEGDSGKGTDWQYATLSDFIIVLVMNHNVSSPFTLIALSFWNCFYVSSDCSHCCHCYRRSCQLLPDFVEIVWRISPPPPPF